MATPYITSFTGDGVTLRNDFDGCVGGFFTVGASSITISQLGRWKISGNSQTHTVSIKANDGTLIASAIVDMSTGSTGTFVYTSISDTVLSASTTYNILCSEVNGGDQWNDQNGINVTVTSDATWGGAAYQVACNGSPNHISAGPGNYCYGPYNMIIGPGTVTGIAFDVAGNSGDVAAANTYSGSASWNGSNRILSVDVSLLGAGTTVTSMTYGGATCTKIGSRSTVTSLGSVECWRICSSDSGAPGTGANTLVVNLSGSIEFTVEWASYTGVNQTLPTEGFNSNQATNGVGTADATVSITSIADNCWVHAAIVANDNSIIANQTSRNNISGTIGSGANEDNNAAVTPAGSTTMSYSGVGSFITWAIAGYAIRPLAASSNNTYNFFPFFK